MSAIATAARMVHKHGEAMTLKCTGQTNLAVRGKLFGGGLNDLVNTTADAEASIKISNAEIAAAAWPGPPRRGDEIVLASTGRTWRVLDCITRRDSASAGIHVLAVAGG